MATYRPRDRYFQKAREKGLPSRAAFKLEELLERYRLARAGARVVDLGCAPGGWLAILGRAVIPGGYVIGVDLVPCRATSGAVRIVTGDIRDPAVREQVADLLGGHADLVTSDLAPKLSGIVDRDRAQMDELLETALSFARAMLKPRGAMVAKVFMGPGLEDLMARLKGHFGRVEIARTRATRPGSAELYVVARDFHGPPHQTDNQPPDDAAQRP
ncbi:MAG TPA: RlmE family RNA methyltransferase [Candidatus Binataceae bacterium]|nr:RlmE family RNA methyltransferase [Candidatus Binataceae bacterium]